MLKQISLIKRIYLKIAKTKAYLVPSLTLLILAVPLIFGLVFTIFPAFSYQPNLGTTRISVQAFFELANHPLFIKSSIFSLYTGLVSCLIAVAINYLLLAYFFINTKKLKLLTRFLSPFLAIPHVTFGLGLFFLFSQTGLIIKIYSELIQSQTPPPNYIFPDSFGLGLIFALALREIPFLFIISLSIIKNFPADKYYKQTLNFGYSSIKAWFISVYPILSKRLFLPIIIVLSFAVSVVDIAYILAPSKPGTLSLLLLSLAQDFDIGKTNLTTAGSLYILILVLISIIIWYFGDKLLSKVVKYLNTNQSRLEFNLLPFGFIIFTVCLIMFLCLVLIVTWAISDSWQFGNLIPKLANLNNILVSFQKITIYLYSSFILAIIASAIAIALTIINLEIEARFINNKKIYKIFVVFLFIPLFIPQISYLFGVEILFNKLDRFINLSQFVKLTWIHLLFVLPYSFLSIYSNWKNFDQNYLKTFYGFGYSKLKGLVMIKLPMMLPSVITAWAFGFSVSLSLYLPNIIIAPEIPTLTTEAVSLASGANNKLLGVLGITQMILPFIAFNLIFLAKPIMIIYKKLII